ncbi:hypothetical protein [Pacificitalea manganoxidans]|nr:hypothetical protein [Pacificitalea manganoxidans]MDR6308116.1 hypothetical protein [Pacificitalea manganoxidans]
MIIYIDESGNFAPTSGASSVSLVAALVFSGSGFGWFSREYAKLRRRLPKNNGEVKGRLLNESQSRRVVDLLRRSGALLEVVATDAAYNSPQEVERHRSLQASAMTAHLTPSHQPSLVSEVWSMRQELEGMSPQLYVQSVSMTELIYNVLYHADIFYAFREPSELGRYSWIIDAKGRDGTTDWEHWWSRMVRPMLQSKSLRQPFPRVEEGDYSYQVHMRMGLPEHLRPFSNGNDNCFDLRPILEDVDFSSETQAGLEAVDILANAVRRSLSGNYQRYGWIEIPRLMIHRNDHYIRLFTVAGANVDIELPEYADVLNDFRAGGRSLFPS